MDQLHLIKQPIEKNLVQFNRIFDEALQHSDALLGQVVDHIRQRKGKLMRPTLLMLVAKEFGDITDATYYSAVTLELLHTASLVHDDIVDESNERRGQASVNAIYGNKVAVLVGDYLLSSSLENASKSQNLRIVNHISLLGKQLSAGEIMQLSNTQKDDISEQSYFDVIRLKTAALFSASAELGALSVNAYETDVKQMFEFGENLGICFQIRDDLFDYFDNQQIGKPTGNDMLEGKLTLPVIYALCSTKNEEMLSLAQGVRRGDASKEDIARLVSFTKDNGGIEYAEECMKGYSLKALDLISGFTHAEVKQSLESYVDFVTRRNI